MHIGKLVAILSLVIVALILVVSVYNDMQPGAAGQCEELAGSVCVLEGCPDGFAESPRHACFSEGWRCCSPESDA